MCTTCKPDAHGGQRPGEGIGQKRAEVRRGWKSEKDRGQDRVEVRGQRSGEGNSQKREEVRRG